MIMYVLSFSVVLFLILAVAGIHLVNYVNEVCPIFPEERSTGYDCEQVSDLVPVDKKYGKLILSSVRSFGENHRTSRSDSTVKVDDARFIFIYEDTIGKWLEKISSRPVFLLPNGKAKFVSRRGNLRSAEVLRVFHQHGAVALSRKNSTPFYGVIQ